jgi:hypothetical protein
MNQRIINLLGSPNHRLALGVAGQQTCRGPQVHHDRSFHKTECGGEESDHNQLPPDKQVSCPPKAEGGCQWNHDQQIDPRGLRPKLKLVYTEKIVRGRVKT